MELKHCFIPQKMASFVFKEGAPDAPKGPEKAPPPVAQQEAKETGLKIPSPEEVDTFLNANKDQLVKDMIALHIKLKNSEEDRSPVEWAKLADADINKEYVRQSDIYIGKTRDDFPLLSKLADISAVLTEGGKSYIANFLKDNMPAEYVKIYIGIGGTNVIKSELRYLSAAPHTF
ncbi:MAG: hypothetical protein AAB588_05320 [Patescibacteria group bacterium]